MNSLSSITPNGDLREFTPLSEEQIRRILKRIAGAKVMVLGDYCLDIYWFVDSTRSEKSLETGLMTHPSWSNDTRSEVRAMW